MTWLVVSNGVLWVAVVVLAVINYALLRQIGVLYERVAPAGALMVNRTLENGGPAPALEALRAQLCTGVDATAKGSSAWVTRS